MFHVICCLLLVTSSLLGSAAKAAPKKGVKRAATSVEEGRRTSRRVLNHQIAETTSKVATAKAVQSCKVSNKGATQGASTAAGKRKAPAKPNRLGKLKKDLLKLCITPGSTRQEVEALLGADTQLDLNERLDKNGKLPLLAAAEHGNAEIIVPLIEQGADCAMQDARGCNILQYAVCWGLADVVKAVHERLGQEAFSKLACSQKEMSSLLATAIQRCHREVIDALRQILSGEEFRSMIPTSIQLQADKHGLVGTYAGQGASDRLRIMYDLMGKEQFTANLMKTNSAGNSILYTIIIERLGVAAIETIRELLDESSFAELMALASSLGENLVWQAAKGNSHKIVRFFYDVMDRDAFVQAVMLPDKKRRTVLHVAARYTSPKVITVLWELLTDDEIDELLLMQDKDNETFLHMSVYGGHTEAVQLCKGRPCFAALKEIKNSQGKTAHKIAIEVGAKKIASLIAGR